MRLLGVCSVDNNNNAWVGIHTEDVKMEFLYMEFQMTVQPDFTTEKSFTAAYK